MAKFVKFGDKYINPTEVLYFLPTARVEGGSRTGTTIYFKNIEFRADVSEPPDVVAKMLEDR